MSRAANMCASPFGALYDAYIERPWLSQRIGRAIWGIDIAPLYDSMAALGRLGDGATIVDAPCGGGVALRGLRPGQRVRYVAADISEQMLTRLERRARSREVTGVEPLHADICALPLPDGVADLCLSYSGLHMVEDPAAAVAEIVRCLKPGGELIGTTFLSEGSRRQRFLFSRGRAAGVNGPCGTSADLRRWLQDGGIVDPSIAPERGFVLFRGRKRGSEV